MANDQIIDNIDIQDVTSEVVEDVMNSDSNFLMNLGKGAALATLAFAAGYGIFEGGKRITKKIKDVREKKQSETEPAEVVVEAEVVEN